MQLFGRIRRWFHRGPDEVSEHLAAQESREQVAPAQDDGMTHVPGLTRRSR
jgi:hypothetical protein